MAKNHGKMVCNTHHHLDSCKSCECDGLKWGFALMNESMSQNRFCLGKFCVILFFVNISQYFFIMAYTIHVIMDFFVFSIQRPICLCRLVIHCNDVQH